MRRDKQVGGSVSPRTVQKANSTEATPPRGFFIVQTMAKKKSILPKAPTEWAKLQAERKEITSRLSSHLVILTPQDREAMGLRLIEVKRQLNRLYAAGQ